MVFSKKSFFVAAFTVGACVAHSAAPVFVGSVNDVPSSFPVGKTLVIPIPVNDPDGGFVTLTAKSNKAHVMARVRSGNYHYKMHVTSTDDGSQTGTPTPFSGDMEFQVFRDPTRDTADFITGYAQSGFYDNLIFHRVIPNFVIQGGDKAGDGSGQAPFDIDHEFRPDLIYTGKGQLAMANSQGGYSQSFPETGNPDYKTSRVEPTNGSQFFVTLGQPRHLDFRHTLFGQLVRGFPTLAKIASVKTDEDNDKPVTPVKMATHQVTASRTDAVLIVSAKNAGEASITITATDSNNESTTHVINVNPVVDTVNDPPILLPLQPTVMPVGGAPSIQLRAFDLEHDAITTRFPVIAYPPPNNGKTIWASASAQNLQVVARPTPGAWDVAIGVAGLNDPLFEIDPFGSSQFQNLEVGVGDKALLASPVSLHATAAENTGPRVLATFRHGSAASSPDDYIALVNWGDGTTPQNNLGNQAPISIVRSSSDPGAFEVRGGHIYARPGVYPLHVTIDGPLGSTSKARGQVAVAAADAILRATGEEFVHRGPNFAGRPLAYFTDVTPGAKVADYTVIIDWGDGQRTPGTVRQVGAGQFAVMGTHRYLDAETFSVVSHIRRAAPEAEVTAWSRVQVIGFTGPQYMPPFSKASITSFWSVDPVKEYRGNLVDIMGALFILNGGDKPTGKWKIKFWLSNDENLSAGDTLLKFGPLNRLQTELKLNSLVPGAGGNLFLQKFDGGDFTVRVPAGETGAGKYIIAQLDYKDPITDKMKVPKTIPFGPLAGVIVERVTSPFALDEDPEKNATKVQFTVRLDTLPSGDVTIPLDITYEGAVNTTRATLSTNSLTFTNADGISKKTVEVTVKDDQRFNTTRNIFVRLKTATSTDLRFNGMDAPDVGISINDHSKNVVVSPVALTIKEGNAAQKFNVRLQTPTTKPVTVALELVDSAGQPTTRATLDKQELTFAPETGTVNQPITVTAVNDGVANGTANLTIRVKPAVTEDPKYSGRDGPDVTLTIQDNDTVGVTRTPPAMTVTEGDAVTRTFSVKLNSVPTSDVTIPLEIVTTGGTPDSSRATLGVTQLVFTPANALTAQDVSVTAVNDSDVNGNGTFKISLRPAQSADAGYNGFNASDIDLTVEDNDQL